jgi:secretion/DNA translocation related TadE-like protein
VRRRDDRGSGTVLVLGVCAAGLVLATLAAGLAAALLVGRRAEAAADLAALAAVPVPGDPPACSRAAAVAAANGARLTACSGFPDGSVLVDVQVVSTSLAEWGPLLAHGRARAGLPSGLPALPAMPGLRSGRPQSAGPRCRQCRRCGRGRTQSAGAPASRASSSTAAPALSSGSLPLPHLGDCTQDGQPDSQAQSPMTVRVARNQAAAAR